jgi:1-acyl-sn-glycerol-3-phosphate acyltransferase
VAAIVATGMAGVFLILSPAFFTFALLGKHFRVAAYVFFFARKLVQGMWLANTAILLETWYAIQMEFYIVGDKTFLPSITMGERAIWIPNHRTRLDAMFLWSFGLRTHVLHHLKIILKDGLRSVPIFGWAMQMFEFIFLVHFTPHRSIRIIISLNQIIM